MHVPIDKIVAYEQGELPDEEVIPLFQELLDTGLVWKLQGSYGRMAAGLIVRGLLTVPKDKGVTYYADR